LRPFRCAVVDMSSRVRQGGDGTATGLFVGSYEVTPSWRAASRRHWSTNLHSRHAPEGAAGKEMGQTSSDVTRTLPTKPSPDAQGNAGGSLIAVKKVLTTRSVGTRPHLTVPQCLSSTPDPRKPYRFLVRKRGEPAFGVGGAGGVGGPLLSWGGAGEVCKRTVFSFR
jgi:hypothetical protein